ncbi:PAS and helix-turn-helix domain-containing protein [Candidatus Symbiopectobacterium sp. NZEC151]|uniref:helix-turn-helix transcriptional regulator n=3 Tax=unclassified Symbiopectobacterium TaxID=2794573 RepID=UPI0022279839|nr:PAS and helix-turn-helix domain-containing protein [Candidatus Symbiopectobacterium sp. NZEC151]MCW2475764.1 PAS domain-containing protein [Candidatus Symbiopectobacterium sp. NZEC151]
MDDGKSKEKKTIVHSALDNIPLVSVMEHASIPWGIKSNESKFVYMNQAAMNFCNIPKGFDVEGRLDSEIPVSWSELAPELQAHDRKAEQSKEGADVIETAYFGRDAILAPWHCAKFPIYHSDGTVLGTMFYAKAFNFYSVYEFFNNSKPSVITLTPPVDIFTQRELEIISFAIRRLSAKEIASRLCLSYRTVQNRLNGIYSKAQTTSLSGLIEYCMMVGLNDYMPRSLLKQKVDFFW